ncbi:hypothetical protein HYS47_02140 [Candidatus Woesearchaeota archaeon]|nr:hypothetical protein [Candidatus Woesearchaeota archaeon]
MHIKRYLAWGGGEPFGIGEVQDSQLFTWYLRGGRVGVYTKIISGEKAGFTYGFLTWGDELIVKPNDNSPLLWRACYPDGVLSAKKHGEQPVRNLVQLLQGLEVVHAFETCPSDGGVANVLTFSSMPPTRDTYRKVSPMRVTVQ